MRNSRKSLTITKIQYAKAERVKSRSDGRSLQMFQIKLKDPAQAKEIISNNITCPQTGITFKVEEFRAPTSVWQSYNCQNFGHLAKNCEARVKCVTVEKDTHTKDAQMEKRKANKVC